MRIQKRVLENNDWFGWGKKSFTVFVFIMALILFLIVISYKSEAAV